MSIIRDLLANNLIPKTRTNFGIFSIRYQGPKTWNSLDESDKKIT